MRTLPFVLVAVVLGSTVSLACSSNPAPTPTADTPSLSGVFPSSAFLARSADVLLSGFATNFSPAATVDFGAGVTVKSVSVSSPTALVASIEVDATAAEGPRDVTVTDGAQKYTLKAAFSLQSPTVVTARGTLAQGSVLTVSVVNRDPSTPFDTTAVQSLLSQTYLGVKLDTLPPGVAAGVTSVTSDEIVVNLETDVQLAPGKLQLTLLSGTDPSAQIKFPFTLDVAARTATPLVAGVPAQVDLATPFASGLYSLTSTATQIVELAVTSSSPTAQPAAVVLPTSGKFADAYGVGTDLFFVPSNGDTLYGVVMDGSGDTKAPISLLATTTTLSSTAAEAASNDTAPTAQVIGSLPFVMTGGTLSSGGDLDWLVYTAGTSDVGKSFVVATAPGDPRTDTVVDVIRASNMSSLGGPSADSSFLDVLVSAPIPAAGNYYIQISASSFFDPSHSSYQAIVLVR
ncbi:MAG TPA: hypothetical protein VLM85_30045 [Polyangiaceae bacterium]|nr:hypothetical protein [Polyangiaceae bacterium]